MGQNKKQIPHLEQRGDWKTLIVDGKPFVALGGELHNSSGANLTYMEEKVWPALRPLGLNTVITPVYWECLEPVEGEFHYELVDGVIDQARREGVRLVFLWFGLWKNGISSYVPAWVKKDQKKYFRAEGVEGNILDCISPLCEEAVTADAKAFAALMKHIKAYDEEMQTVIMMQVENEIGVLTAARDFSKYAEEEFQKEIPDILKQTFDVSGNWEDAFGSDACLYFMGYYYARAVEKITAAGTREYPIPMYANAWLEQFPWIPGTYPSGGPIARLYQLWKTAAPTIAFIAPDIYVDYFRDVCDEYAANGNPLFIPEVRVSPDTASFLYYAVGKHNAMCFSPFGIEDIFSDNVTPPSEALLKELNIAAAAFGSSDPTTGPLLAKAYHMISNMNEVIYEAHQNKKIHGFLQHNDLGELIETKNYLIKISYYVGLRPGMIKKPDKGALCGGFVIELGEDEFLACGVGFAVEFLPKTGAKEVVGLLAKEEGEFVQNKWIQGRILNGDEAYFNRMGGVPTAVRFKLYRIERDIMPKSL